ncbi:hypothetical protein [Arthrobacter sp. MMS24-S77]
MDGVVAAALLLVAFSLPLLLAVVWAAWPFLAELMGVQEVPEESTDTARPSEDGETVDEHFSFYWYYP